MTIPATMMGLAIGDALGAPFEFKNTQLIRRAGWNGEFRPTTLWKGLQAGQWTDDTKMAIRLTMSLIKNSDFNQFDVMQEYLNWHASGDLRGIGGQTKLALTRAINGENLNKTGEIDSRGFSSNRYCGNGTVMRCAPIGVYFRNDIDNMLWAAACDAHLTHKHNDAVASSQALCLMIAKMANGEKEDSKIFKAAYEKLNQEENVGVALLNAVKLVDAGKDIDDCLRVMGDSGRADETIGTATFCFFKNRGNFAQTVKDAVLMGGDTDTRAAIAGALAGTDVGYEGIPEQYLNQVEDGKYLLEMDKVLYFGPAK